MSQKYEKLKTLLKELFQLDQPDLDFGLYRIMHAKSGEVTQFLDRDLLPQVQTALGQYKTADKAELEKELAKAIEQAQALGADAETLPKVKDLRARLKTDAVDVGALGTPEWKDGKPKRLATPEEAERSPRIVKVVRLESYEDAVNNLETRRTNNQQLLLDTAQAQGTDGLKEQYLLRYLLEVETRGSQSLLNVQAFSDPTAYKLKVKRPGSDESREVNVDLLETFNWLIGLTVQHIAAPQTFSAAFERDSEKRLRLSPKSGSRLKQDPAGPYWFRTVTGTTPDGRKALVIWRKLTGQPEQDNLVLDEWFTKQGYSARDSEFDLIYVNGGNNLENLKTPDDRWKVRLIEEYFHRLMFATEGG